MFKNVGQWQTSLTIEHNIIITRPNSIEYISVMQLHCIELLMYNNETTHFGLHNNIYRKHEIGDDNILYYYDVMIDSRHYYIIITCSKTSPKQNNR